MTRDPKNDLALAAHFRLLVESVEDYAIFMLDPTGHVETWNPGARAIKGYTAEEIVGKHISTFYTPEDQEARRPEMLLGIAVRDGRVEDEGWRVRKDGTRFWANVVITAVHEPTGVLIGFGKVTRDLTARRAMEERLRRSEERLATTLDSIGDGVLATDSSGRVTIINRVAQQLTGWSEAEALGRPIDEVFDIINEETRARVENPVTRVLREGTIVGLANHTSLIARDGSERPIADTGAPISDVEGVVRGAVLVFRDATEQRRAEETLRQSEERLRLMIASVRDYAILMLDPDGQVVSWNLGAERILGYQADEIIGSHFSRFFAPEDASHGRPMRELEVATKGGRLEDDGWRVRKDGSRFWANAVLSAVFDGSGKLIGFAKVIRDLTERRRMEEERLHLVQAQEALRLRDEFLSLASHELKTPLTALQLQLQALVDEKDSLGEKLAKKIARAARASDRLENLIETLLDVSHIATGKMTLERESFDLVEVAREVVERMQDEALNARCDLTLAAGRSIVGCWDRRRLEQLLTSLLANAFKHAGGKPVVVVVAGDERGAMLEVRDAGPGLPPGDANRLFGRFERASSSSYGGWGLGLYVARQIAEAHGGSIEAANIRGDGARFTVRLPLEARPRAATPSP